MGTPKDEFLASIRSALGRDKGPPATLYPRLQETFSEIQAQVDEVHKRLIEARPRILEKLDQMARLGGWNVYRAAGYEEAVDYAVSLAETNKVDRLVRSDQPVFHNLPLDTAFENRGMTVTTVAHGESRSRDELRREIIASGIGVTGADYAIAETGTVVVLPRKGLSRLVSLVPPLHLALVRPEDVVETLDDLFLLRRLEYYREGGDIGSYLNFITGPSRTADIEMTLVVGVHGPKEVHLVLLD